MLPGRLWEQAATSRTTEGKGRHTGFWEPVKNVPDTSVCLCMCCLGCVCAHL